VPAARDIAEASSLERWHGSRKAGSAPFDGSSGPPAPYLGSSGRSRACPAFQGFKTADSAPNAFESSCGGYGYDSRRVGSQCYLISDPLNTNAPNAHGMDPVQIRDPTRTAMFCDCAFPQSFGNPKYLIEYSFAEAYFFVRDSPPVESGIVSPSIHFRHRGWVNVVWCDGHVSQERMTTPGPEKFTRFNIGWFGPPENSLFDPY